MYTFLFDVYICVSIFILYLKSVFNTVTYKCIIGYIIIFATKQHYI